MEGGDESSNEQIFQPVGNCLKVIRNIDVLAKILKLNANICGSSLINIRRVRVRRVDLADDHPLPARSRSRWRSIARGTQGGGEQL